MIRVIAYVYNCAYHCPDCTRKRHPARPGGKCDEHGVDEAATDMEGNPVHPVFNTDETPDATLCRSCNGVITEPYYERALGAAMRRLQ